MHARERADDLAEWLVGLGLLDVLDGAGLPSPARGHDGHWHWREHDTGEPLTDARLTELDGHLRAHGDDPRHGVPVALVQLARQARVRELLLASDWLTHSSLAERRHCSESAARFWTARAAAEHRLLVVPTDLAQLVPAFQLEADGEPRPDLAPVLAALLPALGAGGRGGLDPWLVWGWLTTPAGLLGGEVPEQAVRSSADAAVVVRAAEALAARS
ncbi:hypothetical protein [Nocardioides acrostichi]|uniref:Uncharacterized protein n=1 Tax=Nocardioides acrostichi TaxID=2784339 RepID=A0A930Y6W1_9ACTN|nr:hypothetical protein [Nocardioides acrostichi]MBF4161407.1 hypothetical protein [Nocardioides acrostichi]